MEKLLELLREYSTLIEERTGEYGNPIREWNEEELTYPIENMRIKSKEYGFIKWLVDNDKIDLVLDSIIHKHKGIDFDTGKGIVVEKLCDRYESLLMLLSIQDNPIEFLISILKIS